MYDDIYVLIKDKWGPGWASGGTTPLAFLRDDVLYAIELDCATGNCIMVAIIIVTWAPIRQQQ